ncbi:hypothetical protein BV22DRAFT_1131903 [Leucogyrophana mollusca]|uniref:Uncharacterized protein n=1 Tax=Leucogyrophana mollusca TaxID=85980 RepID=A0ACB8BAD0_9AGAM|nr:hypothetical protein BV22DRAFT_1131903 [Leucogyrophana mollusca]
MGSFLNNLWSCVPFGRRPPDSKKPGQKSSKLSDPVEPIQGTIASSKAPPLFGLIIGINQYKSLRILPLRGAVPDANAVQSCLENDLGVPPAHITNLRNGEATRAAILAAFDALTKDPRINPGDPILIYYAGHGGSAPAPPGWPGPKVEMLVPHDYEADNGSKVNGIPDRTVATLLNRLAQEKGDNITVIFDCCHSGSGTRTDETDPTLLVRGIDISAAVPPKLDQEIWAPLMNHRAAELAPGFLHSGLRSHVLLAACGAGERAQEFQGRGLFTRALLDAFATVGSDKLTYTELVRRIANLRGQNPQCEGYNQGRLLFDSKVALQPLAMFKIHREGVKYIMEAGAAHGIADGARFDVYKERSALAGMVPLGHLVAVQVSAFQTTLDVNPGAARVDLGHEGFVVQTHAGVSEIFRVNIAQEEPLISVSDQLVTGSRDTASILSKALLVGKSEADLGVAYEEGRVVFNILDVSVNRFGLARLPFHVKPLVAEVRQVIEAAAHYYWHLRRSSHATALQQKIEFEFIKLIPSEDDFDDYLQPIMNPEGPNLIRDNLADLAVDGESIYGVKIVNKSEVPLFPSLFYFDNSDFSITPYYQPPTSGGKVDAPLPPGESLTIGYGSGGAAPIRIYMRDGQDIDVGFLKLFLSTEPVDLTHVSQKTPFEAHRSAGGTITDDHPRWETILTTVVQRRAQ